MYYIYFLYSQAADKYYVGHSQDPFKRLEQHLSNSGDKYTGSYLLERMLDSKYRGTGVLAQLVRVPHVRD